MAQSHQVNGPVVAPYLIDKTQPTIYLDPIPIPFTLNGLDIRTMIRMIQDLGEAIEKEGQVLAIPKYSFLHIGGQGYSPRSSLLYPAGVLLQKNLLSFLASTVKDPSFRDASFQF